MNRNNYLITIIETPSALFSSTTYNRSPSLIQPLYLKYPQFEIGYPCSYFTVYGSSLKQLHSKIGWVDCILFFLVMVWYYNAYLSVFGIIFIALYLIEFNSVLMVFSTSFPILSFNFLLRKSFHEMLFLASSTALCSAAKLSSICWWI